MEEPIEIYRLLANIPAVVDACISNKSVPDARNHISISSTWCQRDLEKGETSNYQRLHLLDSRKPLPLQISPKLTQNEVWSVQSPSGGLQAIIKDIKNKSGKEEQYIQIWNKTGMVKNINLTKTEKQGKVYSAETFGCLEWSQDEHKIMYVAEKKLPKSMSFFEKRNDEKEDVTMGEKHLYRDDWGERNTGNVMSVICILNLIDEHITTVDCLPDYICPGKAVWCPEEDAVLCIGWWNKPYKLGIIYSPIIRSALFHIDLKRCQYSIVGPDTECVRSLRFSPDMSKAVFLQNPVGGPHFRCSKLNMLDWANKDIKTVVDIVFRPIGDEFPGVFTFDFPTRCWSADNNRIIFTSQWRSKNEIIVVDTASCEVSRVNNGTEDGSWTVYDILGDVIIASYSNPVQPPYLILYKYMYCAETCTGNPDSIEMYDSTMYDRFHDLQIYNISIANLLFHQLVGFLSPEGSTVSWVKLDDPPEPLSDVTWKVMSTEPPPAAAHPVYGVMSYESILMEPKQSDQLPPLINVPHGGPHWAYPTEYDMSLAFLCKLGYAILMVNFRGSTGFGQDMIDSLPGNVGTIDVQDINRVVEQLVSNRVVDSDRMVIMGGSHGGFLTAHTIGQYPEMYRAAVCCNPVLDIGAMSTMTDLPDWCYVESGSTFKFTNIADPEMLKRMWKCSPLQYVDKMKTPLLMMLGAKDLRAPSHQGHSLCKALQARGVKVKIFRYVEDCHPLNKVETEADVLINIVKWFNENLPAR